MKSTCRLVAVAALLLTCFGGGLFLYHSGFFIACRSLDDLRTYIDSFSSYSHLCFFLIQFLSVVLAPIPSNITAAAGGLLFGIWVSFFLTFLAVFWGSVTVFLLARTLGQSFVNRLVSQSLSDKYLSLIHKKTDIFLLLAFLFPFFPDDVLCILAGLTDIPLGRFVTLVVLARPWGLLFACALGGASLFVPWWAMAIIGIIGVILFAFGMKYGDRVWDALLRALERRNC